MFEYVEKEISRLLDEDNVKTDFAIQLAYSGGLDSSCLLDILLKLKKKISFNLYVTYINYNTSAYSQDVLDFLKKNKANIFIHTQDVFISENDNFESQAREKRYLILEQNRKRNKINYTFTAHHYQDQIETLIMKFIEGSDDVSMQGIRKKYKSLFRPLLGIRKKDIVRYSKKNKIIYFEDPSNKDISFKRNKIRSVLAPYISKDEFLANKLKKIRKNSILKIDRLRRIVNKDFRNLVLDSFGKFNTVIIDAEKIKARDRCYLKLLISKIFKVFFKEDSYNKSGRFWNEFLNFINNSKTGSFFILSEEVSALSDRDNIILFNKSILDIGNENRCELSYGCEESILGKINIMKSSKIKVNNKNEYLIDRDKFEKGLFVRNWREGDKVLLKKGTKKVSDLFIDFKVSLIKKNFYPIIEDFDSNIVWIPGLFSKKNNINSDNVILKWEI